MIVTTITIAVFNASKVCLVVRVFFKFSPTSICAGISTVIAPIYVTEVAPIRLRGAAGVTVQVVINVSYLLSQIFGMTKVILCL